MPEPNAELANSYRPKWYASFLVWQIIDWTLLLIITAGSAAAASKFSGSHTESLSLTVAIVGAVYAAFNPNQRAEAYREAWLILNAAVMLNKSGDDIVKAYLRGEQIIGGRHSRSFHAAADEEPREP